MSLIPVKTKSLELISIEKKKSSESIPVCFASLE